MPHVFIHINNFIWEASSGAPKAQRIMDKQHPIKQHCDMIGNAYTQCLSKKNVRKLKIKLYKDSQKGVMIK